MVKAAQEFALGNSILMTVFKEIVDPLPFPSVSPQCIFQFLPPKLKKVPEFKNKWYRIRDLA